MLLLDTNILIDVLRGESVALAWLEQQPKVQISVITWIEVLVGCRDGETELVESWLETFPRLPIKDAVARETVRLRQQHGLKVPDAIILATARCADLTLATRNTRDFPRGLGGVAVARICGPHRSSACLQGRQRPEEKKQPLRLPRQGLEAHRGVKPM
jgi:predicted nucleic acid-binding protein